HPGGRGRGGARRIQPPGRGGRPPPPRPHRNLRTCAGVHEDVGPAWDAGHTGKERRTMTETLAFGTVDTVLGRLLVAETETGVVSLDFRDTPAARARAAKATGLPVVDA